MTANEFPAVRRHASCTFVAPQPRQQTGKVTPHQMRRSTCGRCHPPAQALWYLERMVNAVRVQCKPEGVPVSCGEEMCAQQPRVWQGNLLFASPSRPVHAQRLRARRSPVCLQREPPRFSFTRCNAASLTGTVGREGVVVGTCPPMSNQAGRCRRAEAKKGRNVARPGFVASVVRATRSTEFVAARR